MKPIVDDRGHLLVPKRPAAFVRDLPAWAASPPRWPAPSPALRAARAATMGYKGVQTSYLPRDTSPATS